MRKKQKREFEDKDKIISFALSKEMSMPEMLKIGYARQEIDKLFEKLEESGFGIYQKGKLGRNGAAKFVSNEKCPDKFAVTIKVKRLSSDYIGKPEEKEPVIIDDNGVSKVIEKPKTEAQLILSIEHKPSYVPYNLGTGYVCSIGDDFLFVDRYANGGFKTIEKATDDIWAEIKDYIAAKDSYQMTKKQEVVSKLMGVGFYKLSKEPETQLEVTRKK
ncbi:MAG: hypothetical protein ACOYLO_00510 [Ferruginibacter sp.]